MAFLALIALWLAQQEER